MRITNQMLNETAMKSGLPINSSSLLSYLSNDSSDNTLLSALSKSSSTVDTVTKSSYEKLEKAADLLQQSAEVFTEEGEASLFDEARESGSNQEIYEAAEALVQQYNSVIAALKNTSGTLNDYYRQTLIAAASENSEALENIGITLEKDGTLSIDEDKLLAADVDDLEQALGTSNSFSAKAAVLAAHIADNAQANLESLTSQYTSTGTIYSTLTSKYNLLG